ncbi:RNA polymerase sigma factor [Bacillus suaedae]|uniref:Sigma-70 family RNA polymerase sigma factor n=1 Tax=Halalkalibacter suaedae TaxID=2822140 RepID=A0A941AQL6_9BACI|nr:sigma-70 family RNA polymerase sigma factor [Bacillus suaedae]MBP3952887.1 sigma-70 family RNA polymerase sigma factor [Bacillus suaedae]
MDHYNDEDLYIRIKQHNKEALELLYDRYERILFSFIYRFVKDSGLTEEIMQDLFLKLWKQKSMYDSTKGSFSSWLLTLARNAAIDALRKQKKTEYGLLERDQREDPENIEKKVVQKEENDTIHEAMSTLPNDQQTIVKLFYFEGHTQKHIADTCQIPLGTVKGRIRLALKHLRKKLSREQVRGENHE